MRLFRRLQSSLPSLPSLWIVSAVLLASIAAVAWLDIDHHHQAARGIPVLSHDRKGPEDATYLMQAMAHVETKAQEKVANALLDSSAANGIDSFLASLPQTWLRSFIGTSEQHAPSASSTSGRSERVFDMKASMLQRHVVSGGPTIAVVIALILMCVCLVTVVPVGVKEVIRRPSDPPRPTFSLAGPRILQQSPLQSAQYMQSEASSTASSPELTPMFAKQDLREALTPKISPSIPKIDMGGLRLPHFGSRLGILVRDIKNVCATGNGELRVVSEVGQSKLWVSIGNRVGERQRYLHIYTEQAKREAMVSMVDEPTGALQILGAGKHYGFLENEDSGRAFVTYNGERELYIEGEASPFEISVRTKSGRQVAGARKHVDFLGVDEYIEFGIQPVEDTVLLVACVLAQLLLRRAALTTI
jgi:hypothetical protein